MVQPHRASPKDSLTPTSIYMFRAALSNSLLKLQWRYTSGLPAAYDRAACVFFQACKTPDFPGAYKRAEHERGIS